MYCRIGSGWRPPKFGLTSAWSSRTSHPALRKRAESSPCPAPYITSSTTRIPLRPIRETSTSCSRRSSQGSRASKESIAACCLLPALRSGSGSRPSRPRIRPRHSARSDLLLHAASERDGRGSAEGRLELDPAVLRRIVAGRDHHGPCRARVAPPHTSRPGSAQTVPSDSPGPLPPPSPRPPPGRILARGTACHTRPGRAAHRSPVASARTRRAIARAASRTFAKVTSSAMIPRHPSVPNRISVIEPTPKKKRRNDAAYSARAPGTRQEKSRHATAPTVAPSANGSVTAGWARTELRILDVSQATFTDAKKRFATQTKGKRLTTFFR